MPEVMPPDGEDDHSTGKHIENMKKAYKKKEVDPHANMKAMDLTFFRRKQFIAEGHTIAEICSEYPLLQIEEQVRQILVNHKFFIHIVITFCI